jgi:DNA-binding CsgD family transcriptional regulator
MLIRKDRTIVFANKIARDVGAKVGGFCWQDFAHCEYIPDQDKARIRQNKDASKIITQCSFCLADQALKEATPVVAPEVKAFGKVWEIHWIPVSTDIFLHYALDITDRKIAEQRVLDAKKNLEKKVRERTHELEEMNTALKILLKKKDEDRLDIEEKIFSNYKLLISPVAQLLKNKLTCKDQQDIMAILETNLDDILSPFSKKLSDPMINLTPAEIQVADLIKFGKTNKEISEILMNSIHTVASHRENIRKKLNIKHKKVNLRSFLRSLK